MNNSTESEPAESQLRQLIAALQSGDESAREAARNELVNLTYDRLRRLAQVMLHRDFPRLRRRHDVTSIADDGVLRLLKALREVKVATPSDYFRFAAALLRRTLLDMARRKTREPAGLGGEAEGGPGEPRDPKPGPATEAMWREFHEKVEALPPPEKAVVELHLYHGHTQAVVAQMLGLHPKKVSRIWQEAIRKLPPAPA